MFNWWKKRQANKELKMMCEAVGTPSVAAFISAMGPFRGQPQHDPIVAFLMGNYMKLLDKMSPGAREACTECLKMEAFVKSQASSDALKGGHSLEDFLRDNGPNFREN